MKNRCFSAAIFLMLATLLSCKNNPESTERKTVNSGLSVNKPYVFLISLDGFRWDYVSRFKPPFLSSFIENGVQSESLIPSFPSKTFPNHYTIATGMYPENHGLIGNSFYSYKKKKLYKIGDRKTVEDGTFYGGIPIWVLADQQKMVTASYFFVGSEADVLKTRPTYYFPYDGSTSNEDRISKALEWLDLPKKNRPHLITMYFSDIDDVGHRFSPDADSVLNAKLLALDKNLEHLFTQANKKNLPVNFIIVSDHGMKTLSANHLIPTTLFENDSLFSFVDNGAIINIHLKDTTRLEKVYNELKSKESHFKVYKTKNTPGFEYEPKNKDWGQLQVLPDVGYYFSSQRSINRRKELNQQTFGVHGYTPEIKEMHGIFYAQGPAFKTGYTRKSVKNIHIYPLVAKILNLKTPDNIDGNLEEIKDVLKQK